MKCPFCHDLENKVIDSRLTQEGDVIRRRRQCLNCAKRFTSRERIEDIEYRVVKKDGNREGFQRQKLIAGLLTASEKRPVSIQQLEAIANRIEAELQERPEREMTTEEIGIWTAAIAGTEERQSRDLTASTGEMLIEAREDLGGSS